MIWSVPVDQSAPADVGRVAHGEERLRRPGGRARSPFSKNPIGAGGVPPLGKCERDEGQAHADEYHLAVADLPPRRHHHQLAVGVRPGLGAGARSRGRRGGAAAGAYGCSG